MYILYIISKNEIYKFNDYTDFMTIFIQYNKNDIKFIESNNDSEIKQFVSKYKKNMTSLTNEQTNILDFVNDNKSVFINGVPGSGKSFVLQYIIKLLENKNIEYVLTASTGTAAVNIGGQTLHSFIGLTPFIKNFDEHIKEIKNKRKDILYKILKLQCLIIEEISMIDNVLFDGISCIFQNIKNNDKPFGGIQLILVGDFYQLKPVENDYAFLSNVWNKIQMNNMYLNMMIRQKDDEEFRNILMQIRTGNLTKDTYKKLKELKNTQFPEHIIPTKLFPKNKEVDKINQESIIKLNKPFKIYNPKYKDVKENNDYIIKLCLGAQIMITRNINIDSKIVNGTRGIVKQLFHDYIIITLFDGTDIEISYVYDYINKEKTKWIYFLPIKLAYALSIHKSQGSTLDAIEVDLGKNIFAQGQSYVALSRARNLKSIRIINISSSSFDIDERVLKSFQ